MGTNTGYPSIVYLDSTHSLLTTTSGSGAALHGSIVTFSGTTITNVSPISSVVSNVQGSMSNQGVVSLDAQNAVAVFPQITTTYAAAAPISTSISSSNQLGVALNSAVSGGTVTVATNGIVDVFSGLTAGSMYYYNGKYLTTTPSTYKVGLALSSTTMQLNSGNGAGADQYFGDMVFANAFRIAEGWDAPQSLVFKNQLGREILNINENGGLNASGSLSAKGMLTLRNDMNDFTTSLQSATSTLANLTFTLPDSFGTSTQALMTDGNGKMYWGNIPEFATTTENNVIRLANGKLSAGVMLDNGITAGVNTLDTNSTFTVQSGAEQNPFSVISAIKSALFTVNSTGLVGIGTSTPMAHLDIFQNDNTDALRITSAAGEVKLRISSEGDLFANHINVELSSGAAETFTALEAVDAGTVVAFGTTTSTWSQAGTTTENYNISGIRKAESGIEAVGVVSNSSAITLSASTTNGVPVAFGGRVAVKITTENGEIKTGDYLTVSATRPGYAMKLTGDGKSIGRAVSDYTIGQEKVMMLVENGYQRLDTAGHYATTTGMLTYGNLDLNANGVSITNIKSLSSANGSWSIDENGRIVGKILCLEDVCIDKTQLTNMLNMSGQAGMVAGTSTTGTTGSTSTTTSTTSTSTSTATTTTPVDTSTSTVATATATTTTTTSTTTAPIDTTATATTTTTTTTTTSTTTSVPPATVFDPTASGFTTAATTTP
jgi:hypothetical protein